MLARVVRPAEHVEHGRHIDPDVPLECDDLVRLDLDIAVGVLLEGAGVGHHESRIVEQVVHPLLEGV